MIPTSSTSRLIRNSAFVAALLTTMVAECFGQAARPERGVMPTGSYAITDIENVNLTNGNLNLSIPLASLPPMAGGKLGFTIRAEYNSKGWDTVSQELQSDPLNPATKYVVSHLQQSGVSGWRIGGTYQISFEDITWDYDPRRENCAYSPMRPRMASAGSRRSRLTGQWTQLVQAA